MSGGPLFTDISERAHVFRSRLIEEFRLFGRQEGANRGNEPVYSTADLEKNPHLLDKLLRETPHQLVKFKIFKRNPDELAKLQLDRRLTRTKNLNRVPLGVWASWLVNDNRFQWFIMATVIINSILLGVEAELEPSENYGTLHVLELLDQVAVLIFILEICLKFLDDFSSFWLDGWNLFDFVITLASALPDSVTNVGVLNNFRVVRTFRSLKLIVRFKSLRIIVKTILEAFQEMAFIMVLLLIITYIYAVMAINLFESYTLSPRDDIAYRDKFSSLGSSFVTLFQMLTLDQWYFVHNDVRTVVSPAVTTFFFVSWVCVGAFIFRNTVVGVMVNKFESISKELKAKEKESAEQRKLERMNRRIKKEIMQGNRKRSGAKGTATGESSRMGESHEAGGRRKVDISAGGGAGLDSSAVHDDRLGKEAIVNGPTFKDAERSGQGKKGRGGGGGGGRKDSRSITPLGDSDSYGGMLSMEDSMMSDSSAGLETSRVDEAFVPEVPNTEDGRLFMQHIQELLLMHKKQQRLNLETDVDMLAPKRKTYWPRDNLFQYLQTMETLQENMREYAELQRYATLALVDMFDGHGVDGAVGVGGSEPK